jgi:hypothetical protein
MAVTTDMTMHGADLDVTLVGCSGMDEVVIHEYVLRLANMLCVRGHSWYTSNLRPTHITACRSMWSASRHM